MQAFFITKYQGLVQISRIILLYDASRYRKNTDLSLFDMFFVLVDCGSGWMRCQLLSVSVAARLHWGTLYVCLACDFVVLAFFFAVLASRKLGHLLQDEIGFSLLVWFYFTHSGSKFVRHVRHCLDSIFNDMSAKYLALKSSVDFYLAAASNPTLKLYKLRNKEINQYIRFVAILCSFSCTHK